MFWVAFVVALALALAVLARRKTPDVRIPVNWQLILQERIALLSRLSADQIQRYEMRVQLFLNEKRFFGCGGLAVTDEMRVVIAGLACLLVLRPEATVFPRLRAVLVYPTAFWVRHDEPDDLGLVSDEPIEQIGESWEGDRVVLSWKDVEAALEGDSVNVVAHEMAHQIDDDSVEIEGAPSLESYAEWSRVMKRNYDLAIKHGSPVLDEYGTESPAEFFAVSTEAFFQRGAALKRHHPDLYRLMSDYFQIETA